MTLPYLARLLCLAFAVFFLLHCLASLAVSLVTREAVRRSTSFHPKAAARFLFCLRIFPVAISAGLVLTVLVPSYLLFEPATSTESLGALCLTTALLGSTLLLSGLFRGTLAVFRSTRHLKEQEKSGAPVILVSGFFRSRLVVSSTVRNSLTAEELAAALRHEEAHGRARDNLKRLIVVMCPSVLPFCRCFQTLEAGWRRFAEWAADDSAVETSARDALALASALIRVGRMNADLAPIPLSASLQDDTTALLTRVERLIEGPRDYRQVPQKSLAGVLAAILLALIAVTPSLLPVSHRFLEVLAH